MALFSPEHGIRGTEDRENLANGIDARSGLIVHSLYTTTAIGPPTAHYVGRGTPDAFQRVGAPWLDAERVVAMLNARVVPGLRFEHQRIRAAAVADGECAVAPFRIYR